MYSLALQGHLRSDFCILSKSELLFLCENLEKLSYSYFFYTHSYMRLLALRDLLFQ